jgi:phosphonate transport system substrate-binding protein
MRFNVRAVPTLLRMRYGVFNLLLAWLLVGCSQPDDNYQLKVLRVGVLPDQDSQRLTKRYTKLLDYLANELGVEPELVIPDSYADLVQRFAQKQIDLAYFGGVTYVQAHDEASAVPLVMRDIDRKFTSYFLVNARESAQTITELRARRFSFGDLHSTSGHLMPRYFLQQQNIMPETFFSEVRYSGSHDKTALWVQDGTVDIGVANANVMREMFEQGLLSNDKVRILWETPYYADYVWAVQPYVSKMHANRLRDAFLALSYSNPLHAEILSMVGAKSYLPASHRDFFALETILKMTQMAQNAADITD